MPTLIILEASTRTLLGVPTTDSFHTTTTITRHLNDALHQIQSEWDWEWLEKTETITTVNGTQTYNGAADYLRTINLTDPTGIPLKQLPIQELDYMGAATGGYVRFYAQLKNAIRLFPVPNAALAITHRYKANETELASGSDTTLLPTPWAPLAVNYACYLAELRAGNEQQAAGYLAAYKQFCEQAKGTADRRSGSPGGGGEPSQ